MSTTATTHPSPITAADVRALLANAARLARLSRSLDALAARLDRAEATTRQARP